MNAEQSVIGACLLDPAAFWRVGDSLQVEDFEEPRHRSLWRAISEHIRAGKAADAVTLGDWLDANGLQQQTGGMRYVLELANCTPSASAIESYAALVAERAALRRLGAAGAALVKAAGERNAKPAQVAADARRLMSDAMPVDTRAIVSARDAVRDSFGALRDRFERKDELSGLSTGVDELDDETDGLQPSKLYIIAARPSVGKSLLAGVFAQTSGKAGKRVAIFSAEMSARDWTDRWVSSVGKVRHERIQRPRLLEDDDWSRVTAAMGEIQGWPVFIDDSAVHSLESITARTQTMHAAQPLAAIVVDHLGLLNHKAVKGQNLVDAIGDTTKGFKQLAKALGIPVVLLVQLNRDAEGREPIVGDLRSSGRIEEDADVIVMAHRPGMTDASYDSAYMRLLLRKNRGGRLHEFAVYAHLPLMRVEKLEAGYQFRTVDDKQVKTANRWKGVRNG